MGILNKGSSLLAGIGLGGAARAGAEPVLEVAKQNAWYRRQNRVIDPGTAAAASAQHLDTDQHFVSYDGDGKEVDRSDQGATAVDLLDDTKRQGFSVERFNLARRLQQRVPSFSEALRLWRRQRIDLDTVNAILAREGIPPGLWPALRALYLELLDPGQLAAAIHRGLVKDPGLLKGEQPKEPFNVEAYPVYPIDALKEAQGSGYDKDRLGVLVGLQGLPMGVIEAAQAYFRGTLTYGDYIRAFNESNNRNEWAKAVLEYARQIPTARDYIENALRGYRTLAKAQEGAARHGMSADDALLIFQNSGRPLNLHQITQALAWGGTYKPAAADNPNPWRQAVLLGAVRPEYYDLQEHLKYNLPSAFFFRVLQQQGALTEAEAVTWYERLGWPPDLAKKVATAFAKDTAASADPHVAKAENQLWTDTHRAYLTGGLADADATSALTDAGVNVASIPRVLQLWASGANVRRKMLTPAEIKKAWAKAEVNPATGQPWTEAEALDALEARGYTPNDAYSKLHL